jgi:hypothetical protein
MGGEVRLAVVPGAGHVFEEPALGEAARLATEWLGRGCHPAGHSGDL